MTFDLSKKMRIGLLLLILLAAGNNLLMLREEIHKSRSAPEVDTVTTFEKKLEAFKKNLPVRGVLGYVTDRDPGHDREEYFLIQYALCPVIVASGTNHPFVLGNFHKPAPAADVKELKNLTLLKDLHTGIMLFKHEGKQ